MRRREFLYAWATPLCAESGNCSKLVYPGKDGRLVYTPGEQGNRIPDFSLCGYRGGGVPLPDVAVRAELSPESGDAGARVQAAIDNVAADVALQDRLNYGSGHGWSAPIMSPGIAQAR